MITAPSAWVDTGTNTGTTLDAGHWTGSSAGTYSHTSSNGTIDENEDDHSDSTYHIDSNWSGGAWVNSGASTGHARLTGHWSIDSTGKYTHVGRSSKDGVTDYSSVTGSTGSNYSTDWNSGSTVTQTYVTFPATGTVQASEGWTESSGQQTAGGTVTSGWHYEGNGSNSNTSGSSGNLTGSLTGTYNNSSSITGTQGESERDSAGSTYSLTSNWVPATDDEAASWNTTGTNSGNATHTGHWSSSATGDYNHTTTGAAGSTTSAGVTPSTGSSTVNGTRGTTHVTDWKATSEVTQNWVNVPAAGTVSAHSEWQTATGTGLATTTTNDDWNYSATGTYSDSAHTGSINEGGNNHAGDKSTVHSNWVPASGSATGHWADTGDSIATSLDHGHWSSSGTGTYGRTTAPTGTINVTGTTGVSHSTEWDTKGTITSNLTSHAARVTDDGTSLPASVTWDTGTGNITATGNTDDGWTYGGSGTYSDSTTPSGTIKEDGNNNNHTDYTIHSDWTPSSAATSTAPAFEGHWTDTGTNTGTTLDAGHWTGSSTGTYSHAIGTTGGTVTGTTGVSHVVEWDTTGTVTLAMTTIAASGTVSAHTEWVMSDGVGDNHGSTTDGWGYSGSGTYTDENGTSQTINEDGNNSTVDAYSVHADWDTGTSAFTRTGTKTHTTTDGGHYTTSRHEPYRPRVGNVYSLDWYYWSGYSPVYLDGDTTSATTLGWSHSSTATSRLNDDTGSWNAVSTVKNDSVSTVHGVTSTASGEYTRSIAPAVPGLEIAGSASRTVLTSDGSSFAWSTTLDAAGSLTGSATTAHSDHEELDSLSYEGSGSGSISGPSGYFLNTGYTESGENSVSGEASGDWTLSGTGQWERSGGHSEHAGHRVDAFELSFSEGGNEFSHTLSHAKTFDQAYSRSMDMDGEGNWTGSGSGTGTRSEHVDYRYDSEDGLVVWYFTGYYGPTFHYTGQSDYVEQWERSYDGGAWTGTTGQTYSEDDTTDDGPVRHYDHLGPVAWDPVQGPWNEAWTEITPNDFEPLVYRLYENPFAQNYDLLLGSSKGLPDVSGPPAVTTTPAAGNPDAPAIQPVCFAAGTLVLMADGSSKAIESIQKDELVLAADHLDPEGDVRPCRVAEAYHNAPRPLVEVNVLGQAIRSTGTHPFYVQDRGWTAAKDLQPGDKLRTPQREWAAVDSVKSTGRTEAVYNLQVEGRHTYFIQLPGTNVGVLVHNEGCGEDDSKSYWDSFKESVSGGIAVVGAVAYDGFDFSVNVVRGWTEANAPVSHIGANTHTAPGAAGRNVGHWIAAVQGAGEVVVGGGGELFGIALDATGVGSVAGVPINVAAAGVITHGIAVAGHAVSLPNAQGAGSATGAVFQTGRPSASVPETPKPSLPFPGDFLPDNPPPGFKWNPEHTVPGSQEGNFFNPDTGESIWNHMNADASHGGPHIDYRIKKMKGKWKWFPDGRFEYIP